MRVRTEQLRQHAMRECVCVRHQSNLQRHGLRQCASPVPPGLACVRRPMCKHPKLAPALWRVQ